MSASPKQPRLLKTLFSVTAIILAALAFAPPAHAGAACMIEGPCPGSLNVRLRCVDGPDCSAIQPGDNPPGCTPTGCGGINNCLPPTVNGPRIEVTDTGGGTFAARLVVDVTARWNDWAGQQNPNGTTDVIWYARDTLPEQCEAPGVQFDTCEYGASDRFETYLEQTGLTCAGAPYDFGVYSVQVKVCQQPCACIFPQPPLNCICGPDSGDNATWRDFEGLVFEVTGEHLGCSSRSPRKHRCGKDRCQGCVGEGVDTGGDGPSFGDAGGPLATGPGATLRYTARGVGYPGHPGSALVNASLGRFWMHEFATRVVPDPDPTHVWLLEADSTFREFTDAEADGIYELASPSNEYRSLTYSGSGWTLRGLDGMVTAWNSSGRWLSTTDRNGNAKVGEYDAGGNLVRVTLPDGREETFTYEVTGKLREIVELGVGGTDSLRWTYTWSGLDLAEIGRPDGTLLQFFYADLRHPGLLTRIELLGSTTGSTARPRRVIAAYEYDAQGNVVRTWRGDKSFTGANAVDAWQLSYDDPSLPALTTVTDPLGGISTYTLGREAGSNVPRLEALSGDCPTCGTGPNSLLFYEDVDHPLLPTRQVDGNGNEMHFAYDEHGQKILQIEAFGEAEERITLWEYHPTFSAFPTAVIGPTASGGTPTRRVDLEYDLTTGDLERRTDRGLEETQPGGRFDLVTETTYNGAGKPLSVDPPGHGTDDVTSFTYDATRGSLLPLSRTEPLGLVTSFTYDPFNRTIGARDPNNLLTETRYDAFDRVRFSIERSDDASVPGGPILAADLVTEYRYNGFGDLRHVILSRANVIEHSYDNAGRLISTERKATTSASSHGDRRIFTLDAAGNRTREELQRWNGSVYVVESSTDYLYQSRCQLAQVIHPDGSASEHGYDCNGNLSRTWDANHPSNGQTLPETQSYTYDSLDRLRTVSERWGGAGGGTATTTYAYDAQDHLLSVTDAEGNATSYAWSERDLLIRETMPWLATGPACTPGDCSAGCGCTRHTYDEHGELAATSDPRGIALTRTVDALDRVTAVDYPGTDLDIAYTYGTDAVARNRGRLIGIDRGDSSLAYAYDRYGRVLQDGDLSSTYDENGNRLTLVYPGVVTATYGGFDFADRETSLTVQRPGEPNQTLVSAATYKAFGPLATATFGNTLSETRDFSSRYFPDRIQLKVTAGGALRLDWDYATDFVGNVTSIQQAAPTPAVSRTFGYQDVQYFLTQGDGPWGSRSWSYDRIGNRKTETRGIETDTYTYTANGSGGNTPKLSQVALGALGTRSYSFGAAGHLEEVDASGNTVSFATDDAGRTSRVERAVGLFTDFAYDGRDFLFNAQGEIPPALSLLGPAKGGPGTPIFADGFEDGTICAWSSVTGPVTPPPATCPKPTTLGVAPTYSSEGLLHRLVRDNPAGPEEIFYFHFAGRPVAQMERTATADIFKWLTTDHLGTPVAASSSTGTLVWSGGFEPFGADWSNAAGNNVELRLPGQWMDNAWEESSLGAEVFYNVHRWYERGTGKYTRKDPIAGRSGQAIDYYSYGLSNPVRFVDPLGLFAIDPECDKCVNPILARDNRPLSDLIRRELRAWCISRLTSVTNVGLRKCIQESCRSGRVSCSRGDSECAKPATLGYTANAGLAIHHWMRRNGIAPVIRRAFVCANELLNFRGEAGNTVAHEWAHGCGYDPDDCTVPGITCLH